MSMFTAINAQQGNAAVFFGQALTSKVAIYVPGTFGTRGKLNEHSRQRVCNIVSRQLANLFGGATATAANGAYVADDGGLVNEQVTIVYSYTSGLNDDQLAAIAKLAKWLKKVLRQECISVEVDSALYFV